MDADLVFIGARLRPGPDDADALAVRDGRIAAVGRSAEIGRIASARTIDLAGRVLAPGFIDAHNHLAMYCVLRRQVDCRTALDGELDEVLGRLARHAADPAAEPAAAESTAGPAATAGPTAAATAGWVRGWGLAPYRLRQRRAPTLAELDAACPARPLVLLHISGHTAQVNSAGLRRLGLDASSVDPPGGRIERDPDGAPTGVLHETAMMHSFGLHAMAREFTALPLDEQVAVLAAGAADFAALGLTTSCDALASPELIALYRETDRRGQLPCNVVVMPFYDWCTAQLLTGDGLAGAGDRVHLGAVKLFADGSLSGATAAVSQPYQGSTDRDILNRGILHRGTEELSAIVRTLDDRGFQIAVHAIGDRAIEQVAHAYAAVIGRGQPNQRRHRLEHVGIAPPALLAELARIDAVVATQPRMLYEQGDGFLRSCGEERMAWVYPYRAMIDAGLHVAGSSDCPVVSADPLLGMRDAICRRTEQGRTLAPEQCLDGHQALRMWTEGAAYSLFMEHERGTLTVGAVADLVVLSADPLTTGPDAWDADLAVELTVVGGAIEYARPGTTD
jgi:predicted amidohydrolase YtcJ